MVLDFFVDTNIVQLDCLDDCLLVLTAAGSFVGLLAECGRFWPCLVTWLLLSVRVCFTSTLLDTLACVFGFATCVREIVAVKTKELTVPQITCNITMVHVYT